LAGLFVAAEFGGRTFLVDVGFRHLFGGMIGRRAAHSDIPKTH
jgi:hypothetical protein